MIFLILLLNIFSFEVAQATVFIVNPGESIQEAVSEAFDCDTVLVQPGSYAETVVLYGRSITIGSLFLTTGDTSFVRLTVISPNFARPDTASCFVYAYGEDISSKLAGLTLLNGRGTRSAFDQTIWGGGLFIYNSSVNVDQCEFDSCTARLGGGCMAFSYEFAYETTANFSHCKFSHCDAFGSGGALYARSCSLRVANCVFDADTSYDVGGLFAALSAIWIDSSQFVRCTGAVGGLYLTTCVDGIVGNCDFTDNRSNGGLGAAHMECLASNVVIERNTFRLANTVDNPLELFGNSPEIRFLGNVIENNTSVTVTGTLLTGDINHGEIAYNLFRDNRNSNGGAVFALQDSRVRIHHNVFANNVSDDGQASVLYALTHARPTLDSNWIVGNSGVAIRYDFYQQPLNARNNWWGDPSGPYHPTLNPGGQGDTLLSDSVLFIPWLTEPPDTTMPQAVRDRDHPAIPKTWELLDLYPNPFNSSIRIVLAGFTGNDFEISLHNLLGQVVDVIHRGALTGGELSYQAPAHLASGVYFVKAHDHQSVQTMKVILMK